MKKPKLQVETEKLLEEKKQQLHAEIKARYPLIFMKFNQPQRDFLYIKNSNGKTPKRRIFEAGNKEGKTFVGIAEDIAHAIGHRPWLKEDHPDYKIDVAVPNTGLIGCETIAHSVPEKIEPMLRMLIPDFCKPIWKLGPTGALKRVTIQFDDQQKKCGSVIYVRSYDEHESTYEGIDYNWVHWDEPPPQKVLKAAERGKVVTNAPSWFTMTPLKEPYIYDQFSLNAFTHGGLDPEIAVVRGSIWDNCRNHCWYCKLDIPENDEVRDIKRCPKCNRLLGFIPKAGIDEYLKTLDPDERESREFGVWHHLSGLVYKELSRDYHIYQDFPIPHNWMRVEAVDPHDARPTCWLYGAIAPEEIQIYGKVKNRIYFYDYLLLDGNLDDMVKQIKAKRVLNGYGEPAFVVLDRKFGEKKEMEERSWETELSRRGIHRIRLSHSDPGDVELGHKVVKEYLKLHYSSLLGLAKPGIMFAKEGCGGRGGPIHFMFNYQYKEGYSKPEEDYKDWPDTVRYVCMEQPIYREPEEYRQDIRKLADRNQRTIEQRRNVLRVAV